MVTMRRIVTLLCALALLSPTSAAANTKLVMPDGPAAVLYQSWVDQSSMPSPSVALKVNLENCDADAMTCMVWARGGPQLFYPDLSYLWTEAGRSREEQIRMHTLFMHELGHVFDYYTSRRHSWFRRRFMKVMHLRGGWWCWDDGKKRHAKCPDVSPGEQFADAYAYASVNVWPDQSPYEGYRAYRPGHGRHSAVAALIRSASL